jgi:tripeptidyl-peptidase-1
MSQQQQAFFGTSASAPVVASMVSIVNSLRELKNLSTIGFINPTLYENPDLFNDIIDGKNNCCHGQSDSDTVCCNSGFYTDVGWDPVNYYYYLSYYFIYIYLFLYYYFILLFFLILILFLY